MRTDREFVHNRNDINIPSDRIVEVIDNTSSRPAADEVETSVIIPTKDGHRNGYLPSLLKQLSQQTYKNFEIILVKGDSRQGRAINCAADIARGKYLLTLDDDTSLQNIDAIEKLVEVLNSNAKIGMAGGLNVIPVSASRFVKSAMREIPRRCSPRVEKITDSDLAEHPLLMIRRDIFIEVGGENELMPRGLDPYLRQKFRAAGWRVVVVPKVYYSHLPPPTLWKLIKQFFRNGKQAAFCTKFFPQWVVETPDRHIDKFVEKRTLPYRIFRLGYRIISAIFKRRWVYMISTMMYAVGFSWGYLTCSNYSKP